MLNIQDISETIQMIRDDHFDIRTITLGINLLGCISERPERTAARRSPRSSISLATVIAFLMPWRTS